MAAQKRTPKPEALQGRAMALKSLKKFSSIRMAETEENLGDTVMRETDRGAVILLSTAIEDMLSRRIKHEMVPLNSDETARLFGADSVLGTFSAKIKMAQAMGYIDRETTKMCDLIREMRNACAHSGRHISFANEELSDVMRVAFSYISDEQEERSVYKEFDFLGKLHFIWLVSYLMHVIRTGSKESAIEFVNRLVESAKASAQAEIEKQKASPKKHRVRSSQKNRIGEND